MNNPYDLQPEEAFWRRAVSDRNALNFPNIYKPRFEVNPELRISCAGSCFAQHIGAQFKKRGYNFNDLETPPPALPREKWHAYGFDLYSTRSGNVYTPRQLVQLFARARGELTPLEEAYVDENGRARDPFRPAIEPDGFADLDELLRDRQFHLSMVSRLLRQTDLFVFTLGLTESWETVADNMALPACPGTVGGVYDPDKYRFKNFSYEETKRDVKTFMGMAREMNPQMRFLFTISPVPLTATATDQHVLPATVYSKSVLRAVVGELYQTYDYVDYFPSYELVASHPMRAMYYMPNLRNVSLDGVANVMDVFFSAIGQNKIADIAEDRAEQTELAQDDLVCEEEILEVFGR